MKIRFAQTSLVIFVLLFAGFVAHAQTVTTTANTAAPSVTRDRRAYALAGTKSI